MSHPLSQPVGSGAAPRLASGAALPRVLTSVPAGLAVAVRLSFSRYLFTSRRAEVVLFLVAGLGMIAGGVMLLREPDQMVHSDGYGDMDGHLLGWVSVALAVIVLGYLTVSPRRRFGDGFAVGADHTGVYLRPNLDRTRVAFIPWAGVEGVRVRKWHGPQLVVKPHDRVIEGIFELQAKSRWEDPAGKAIAQRRRIKRLGSNIHVPIPGVDRGELLNNLRYQAAGRAPVEMP